MEGAEERGRRQRTTTEHNLLNFGQSAMTEGEESQRQAVVLISEDAHLQKQLSERYPHLHIVSRKMFLDSTWLEARDAFLKDSLLMVAELPRCRTASGTRSDRKIMDRFTTYLLVARTWIS